MNRSPCSPLSQQEEPSLPCSTNLHVQFMLIL
uniref:Fumarylacetoacetase n=1 Tax=Rhizophora mucronata TaxID=61149 RepID=A0A2P2LIG6_RHIMU